VCPHELRASGGHEVWTLTTRILSGENAGGVKLLERDKRAAGDGILSAVIRHIIHAMRSSFEETIVEVWRQALVENAKFVEVGTKRYPVQRTPKRGLRQVDFVFEGHEIRGLEQNPATGSRWAQLARSGKKVMQFLSDGRYVANVVDGKAMFYGPRR